jgi:replicative DNA helicase
MDVERLLLGKVAHTGQIEQMQAAGITEEHFNEEIHRDIYRFMCDHARKFKGAPSLQVIRSQPEFENYNFELATDSLEYLKDAFIKLVKKRFAITSLQDLAQEVAKGNVEDFDGMFLETSRKLAQLMPSAELARFSDMEKRIDEYETGERVDLGIRMGIPAFDKLTFGIQPHEFVTISGWQGTGKSTLSGWIVYNAWMQDRTSLVVSLEMEAPALMRKWDTMLTNFEYNQLKAGTLSAEDLENWRLKAKQMKEKKADIIVKDDVRHCTPDYVYAQIVRYEPDLVVVDYISLMETARSQGGTQMWEKVTYLTQALKQIARTTGTPIIGVAQTNINSAQGGARLDNISYSRSIGQDSDIVIGLNQDDEMKENKQMEVRLLKNRDGATCETDMFWDMSRMKFGDWNETSLYRRREERKEADVQN